MVKSSDEIAAVLSEIPGVRKIKVETGPEGIEAVRVLAMPERDPAGMVREIRAVAALKLDLDLDQQLIDVLTAGKSPAEVRPASRRRRITTLTLTREPERFVARIALETEGDTLIGESSSPIGRREERRCVVEATLDALSPLFDDPPRLQAVEQLRVAGGTLVVVYLTRRAGPLVGSALVRVDEFDAVARATLDALNRALGLIR
jgi:hypothetical protein